jgi:hypothetical protein
MIACMLALDNQHTRRVLALRRAFPAVAILLVCITIISAFQRNRAQLTASSMARPDKVRLESLEMKNPRLYGMDASNSPFALAATIARQQRFDGETIWLEGLKTVGMDKLAGQVVVAASQAVYDKSTNQLILKNGIQLNDGRGYALGTNRLYVDVGKRNAWTASPVSGNAPFGAARGDGLVVNGQTRSLRLTGNTALTVEDSNLLPKF